MRSNYKETVILEYNRNRRDLERKRNIKKNKKYRKMRLMIFYFILLLTIFFITFFFMIDKFFKLTEIDIIGSKKYSLEKIKSITEIEMDENIFKIRSDKIKDNIINKLKDIDNVIIKKQLPNKVIILITEARPRYVIKSENKYYLVSKQFRILEINKQNKNEKLLKITGLKLQNLHVGNFIPKDNELINIFRQLKNSLYYNGYNGINIIDLKNKQDLKVKYQNRLLILFGNISDIEYKVKFIKHIIDNNLDLNSTGIIDATSLLINSKVYFSPKKEEIKNSKKDDKYKINQS